MEDATGQIIRLGDSVVFKPSAAGAQWDHGQVLELLPGPNKVVVQCVDGAELTQNACDVFVEDRSYLRPGIAVASASDRGGQLGLVMDATMALDLVRLDGGGHAPVAVARAVPPAKLRRVREFSLGDYVVSGPWLGRVFEVSLDVDVVFDGGAAVCRVARASSKLWTVNKDSSLNRHINGVFYPGRRVGGRPSAFQTARWLKGYWKPSHGEGTVSKVETAAVFVYWVASSRLGTERSLVQSSAPAHEQSPHNLTFFCSGDPALSFWCVSDRCFFRAPCCRAHAAGDVHRRDPSGCSCDRAHTDFRRGGSPGGNPQKRRNRLRLGVKRRLDRRRSAEFEQSMSVSATRTTADVVWQDGTRQCGVPSVSLLPSLAQNDHDFFPGERVVCRTAKPVSAPNAADVHGDGDCSSAATGDGDDDPARLEERVGVVGSVNYKDQTVRVSWFKAAARDGEPMEIDYHESLSAYDLNRNSTCNAFYGDVVIRHSAITDAGGSTEEPMPPAQGNKEKAAATAANDLSWVGHIVDLCGAHVQVKWGDGTTSKVLLHEIAVVETQGVRDMLQELGDWVAYEDGDMNNAIDNPQETAAAITNNGNGGQGDDASGSESDDEDAGMRRPGWLGAVTQALIRLACGVLAQGRRYLVSGSEMSEGPSFAATENTAAPPTPMADGEAKEAFTAAGLCNGKASDDDKSSCFPQFDVVQSPLDHHYLDNMEQGGTGGRRKWAKRVQKEWKILENNLPDTIYVRAYEDRMDLLRVVMVGASGTPYHDGLFFFDLQLPPSYPATPPLVSYRSFGLRVNPNLYPSGTVCLSLLSTFGGEGTELWSPEASSVLQVVVSIQGLVLTVQPYYNEAGYGAQVGTPEGRRNELPYSENAYVLTLQTMLHVLRRPPAGFEELVRGHFRRRGRKVLRTCEAYLDGCLVGTLDAEARAMEGSRERPCSAGFRLALGNVMPRLVEAFATVGAEGRGTSSTSSEAPGGAVLHSAVARRVISD